MSRVFAGLTAMHRVLGTGMSLLVLLWFGSGAVLVAVPYPSLTEAERFTWLAPLQLAGCCAPLESVWAQAGVTADVERIRLLMVAGRPAYVIHFVDGRLMPVWADRGDIVSVGEDRQASDRAWQGLCPDRACTVEGLQDDQWTVQQHLDPYRPLWKVSLPDEDGREVYVSSQTGEVVMDTTAFERHWNYAGAVMHWLYVPVLRRHWALWDRVVWGLAATGVVVAVTGMVLGLRWRGRGLSSPFTGVARWHHLSGVGIGLVVCTWLFSGLLSMDHGRWFSRPEPTRDQRLRFMGGPVRPQDIAVPLGDALRQAQLGDAVKEINITKVGGVSYYVLRSDSAHQVVVNAATMQSPLEEFSLLALTQAASAVFPAQKIIERSEITQGDTYYYSTAHNPRPLPAVRVVVDDSAQTWLHIDMHTGQLMELMDHSRRVYRWLFHGLHSWDVPFLLVYDCPRKIMLGIVCVVGLVFSLSAVYLGLTVLVGPEQPKPPIL